jgi:hypothetical protein
VLVYFFDKRGNTPDLCNTTLRSDRDIKEAHTKIIRKETKKEEYPKIHAQGTKDVSNIRQHQPPIHHHSTTRRGSKKRRF